MKIDYNPGSSHRSGRARWRDTPFVWWDERAIVLHVVNPPSRTRQMEDIAHRMNVVARDHALPYHVIISHRKWYVVPHAGHMDPIPFVEAAGTLAVTIKR